MIKVLFSTLSYPIMWSNCDHQAEELLRQSEEGKNRMAVLHDNGYHATLMSTHVISEVAYVNYYLEKK